ncbi:MAG: hypothetical protein IPG99_11650 [Ignavibacteria bacterium]|nr:hypothetical protein [Ignavibacteria bacterium]
MNSFCNLVIPVPFDFLGAVFLYECSLNQVVIFNASQPDFLSVPNSPD